MYRQSEKNLLSSNTSSTCPDNMVHFSPLTAEIGSGVWGTPANCNGFRILAALLNGTPVVRVSQTLWHWTDGTTYIRQGGHHVGHWPHSSSEIQYDIGRKLTTLTYHTCIWHQCGDHPIRIWSRSLASEIYSSWITVQRCFYDPTLCHFRRTPTCNKQTDR